jgi:outer membrane protein W
MKKLIVCSLVVLFGAFASLAVDVDVSANAGMYTAPGGIGTSTMYGVSASQAITDHLAARLSLLSTTYSVAGQSTTFTPISLDLIYSQPMAGGLTPYAGAGLSYNSTSTNTSKSETAGAQALAGVRYNLGGFTAGVEYKYIIPDLSNSSVSASAFNGYATSSISHSFSF